MNLYFRLMRLIITCFFLRRQKIKITDKLMLTSRVWLNDIDFNGHMNNGRYLTIMDLGRVQLVARLGLVRCILKQHIHPVAAGASIVYFKSLKPFERFTLTTQVIYWDADWFYVKQDFYSSQNALSASALVRVAFVKASKRIDSFAFLAAQSNQRLNMPQPDMPAYLHAFLAGEKVWLGHLKNQTP